MAKKRKPKVKIDVKKAITASIIIAALCLTYLFLTLLFDSVGSVSEIAPQQVSQQTHTEKNDTQKVKKEEKQDIINKVSSTPQKAEVQKKEAEQTKTEQKQEQPKQENTEKQQGNISPYEIPPAQKNATLYFLFDDAGGSTENLVPYISLPFPVTIAVLPKLKHTKDCAFLIEKYNKELLLHQPMQPENISIYPGPGTITGDMNTQEAIALLQDNISELGSYIKGVNNHEGSLITKNLELMTDIISFCKEKDLYFLDSRTTAATKSKEAGIALGIQVEERDVFLDNIIEEKDITKQIYAAISIANKNGKAIIIGHVDKSKDILPKLLSDMYPYMIKQGYKFGFPSQLYN